jgi:hypothetical protein
MISFSFPLVIRFAGLLFTNPSQTSNSELKRNEFQSSLQAEKPPLNGGFCSTG